MSYSSITWLPLAAGLTILGLVLSYIAYRRRGLRPALMGTAWSLLPIAAYLTGAIEMLWKVGAAIGQFGTGFVFSRRSGRASASPASRSRSSSRPAAAAAPGRARGAQGRPRRPQGRGRGLIRPPALAAARTTPGTQILSTQRRPADRSPVPAERAAAPAPAKGSRKAAAPDDDDMKDIEDILRKRGL